MRANFPTLNQLHLGTFQTLPKDDFLAVADAQVQLEIMETHTDDESSRYLGVILRKRWCIVSAKHFVGGKDFRLDSTCKEAIPPKEISLQVRKCR